MLLSEVTLLSPYARPIQAGMEVFTPRGFGTVVGPFVSDGYWLSPVAAYVVELDDDQGRTVVRAADLQAVERVGT